LWGKGKPRFVIISIALQLHSFDNKNLGGGGFVKIPGKGKVLIKISAKTEGKEKA